MSIHRSGSGAYHFIMRPRFRRFFPVSVMVLTAALAGLALRLFLVLRFPTLTDDSAIYEELARNWLDAHIYGFSYANRLIPSDIRVPGYPAFLILVYLLIGRGERAIVLAQAILDLGSCFLVASFAAFLAPSTYRRRIALLALWLAATCPFIANYAAAPLTEVLATFLSAAVILALTWGFITIDQIDQPYDACSPSFQWVPWLAAGLLAGLGTLVRPETPLLLASLAVVLAIRWRRRADWGKLLRIGMLTGVGLVLPLMPWAARNAVRLHEVQFLSPRYAATPDEYTPRGLYAWTATWLMRFRDVYLVPWNIGSVPVYLADISPSAFDSPDERARVAALLDQYDATLKMTPEIDRGFAALARERTARHPLRTYLAVPVGRAATMWFTPRVDLLPFSGHFWPIRQQWRRDRMDVSITLFLGALNFLYVGLAFVGSCRAFGWKGAHAEGLRWSVAFLIAFILIRTAFLTTVETPEPRYVLECYPAVLALGAMIGLPRDG